jgi:hypothetical protein
LTTLRLGAPLLFRHDSDCNRPAALKAPRAKSRRLRVYGIQIPPSLLQRETLKAVEDAFQEVLDTLANDPHWIANNAGLRVAVIHRLLELVEDGFRPGRAANAHPEPL